MYIYTCIKCSYTQSEAHIYFYIFMCTSVVYTRYTYGIASKPCFRFCTFFFFFFRCILLIFLASAFMIFKCIAVFLLLLLFLSYNIHIFIYVLSLYKQTMHTFQIYELLFILLMPSIRWFFFFISVKCGSV